ncbi:MAG: methylmalonyl-CoA epimerase [Thermoplasmata archaeon]|nr:MAG: methylmalonyl-CoA epimerase [Thermoplasmata archaeon]
MIEKLDHIGIAVKDIDSTLKFYSEALGLKCTHVEEVSGQHVKIAFLPVGGVNLELLQSTDPEGAVAKFIEKKGEGIQHIAFKVENIEMAMQALKEKGVEFIDAIPRKGAHGSKIAFLHPRSAHGVLIELVEK